MKRIHTSHTRSLCAALITLGFSLFATEAAADKFITRTFEVADYSALSVSTCIKVVYTPTLTDERSISARINEKYADKFRLEAKDGKLSISIPQGVNGDGSEVATVTIKGPMLNRLKTESMGQIELKDILQADGELRLSVSSAGIIKGAAVVCTKFKADLSSAGTIELDGIMCDDATVSSESAAIFDANKLVSGNFDASGSSMGRVNVDLLYCESFSADFSSMAKGTFAGVCNKNANLKANSNGAIEAKELTSATATISAHSMSRISCSPAKLLSQDTSNDSEVKLGKTSTKGEELLEEFRKRMETGSDAAPTDYDTDSDADSQPLM